jgi:prevent-host-death family protein
MKVTSAEFIKNYGSLVDSALNRPVTITKHGRDRLVVLSAEAYAQLTASRGDKTSPPQALRLEDFSQSELSLIAINAVPGGPDAAPGGLLFVFVGVAKSDAPGSEPRSAVMLVFTREGEPPVIRIFPMASATTDEEGDTRAEPATAKPRKRTSRRATAALAEAGHA